MKLYIDDIRMPKNNDFVIVRSYNEAIKYMIDFGIPNYISFDHDISSYDDNNNELTGYDIAKWIIDRDMATNELPEDFDFNVHSANPIGAKNIKSLLNNYLKFKLKGIMTK